MHALSDFQDIKDNPKELEQEFKQQFPVVQIYYIDKIKFLPCKYEFYNANAEKIYEHTYHGIELLNKVDDKLFEIPADSHIMVFNSYKEYKDNMNEITSKVVKDYTKTEAIKIAERAKRARQPGILSAVASYIDTNFNSISSILATVLFWVAMGLFTFAGIYKWKNRKHIESAPKRVWKPGSVRKK